MQSGGSFDETISELLASITEQDGTRLPNARRQENRQRLMREGIPIEKELFETLQAFAWINFESAKPFVDRKNILNVKNWIWIDERFFKNRFEFPGA